MGLSNYRLAKEIDVRRSASATSSRGKAASRRIRMTAVPLLWTHRRLVAAASGRLRHAPCTDSACEEAREDQTVVGAPGGESIMSTPADNAVTARDR